jgi:hypothetical protein
VCSKFIPKTIFKNLFKRSGYLEDFPIRKSMPGWRAPQPRTTGITFPSAKKVENTRLEKITSAAEQPHRISACIRQKKNDWRKKITWKAGEEQKTLFQENKSFYTLK